MGKNKIQTNNHNNNNLDGLEFIVKKISFSIGGAALIFILITLAFYSYHFNEGISDEHKAWAEFGSYFGGTLNPVFSLLSLVAILATLLFQAKQLYRSSIALKEQAEFSRLQAFESTFFSMVIMHNENLKSLDLEDTETEKFTGRAIFRIMRRRLSDSYATCKGSNELQKIKDSYQKFYNKNSRFIGHYLRTLNHILDVVINSNIENKDKYLQFIIAQLSEFELIIIFYHSLVTDNFVKFEVLKKHHLFQELVFDSLVNSRTHKAYLD